MNKREMSKIALMGLASSLCVAAPVAAIDLESEATVLSAGCGGGHCGSFNRQNQNRNKSIADNDSSVVTDSMVNPDAMNADNTTTLSEQDFNNFRSQLNEKAQALFDSFDSRGKTLAIQLSKSYSDKNDAVKVAAQKIAQKRSNSNGYPNAVNSNPNTVNYNSNGYRSNDNGYNSNNNSYNNSNSNYNPNSNRY